MDATTTTQRPLTLEEFLLHRALVSVAEYNKSIWFNPIGEDTGVFHVLTQQGLTVTTHEDSVRGLPVKIIYDVLLTLQAGLTPQGRVGVTSVVYRAPYETIQFAVDHVVRVMDALDEPEWFENAKLHRENSSPAKPEPWFENAKLHRENSSLAKPEPWFEKLHREGYSPVGVRGDKPWYTHPDITEFIHPMTKQMLDKLNDEYQHNEETILRTTDYRLRMIEADNEALAEEIKTSRARIQARLSEIESAPSDNSETESRVDQEQYHAMLDSIYK
jgi:hypothetical protein